jgi:hypothetical protein
MARKAAAGALTIDGGRRPRKRKATTASWSKTKERRFLEALGESCNVTLAAEQAGVSASAAYRRRQREPAFRTAWRQAMAVGYAQLELMLLQRALHGVEKVVTPKNGDAIAMREYSDQLGIALLRHHRDTAVEAEREIDNTEAAEAMERILHRLGKLRQRPGSIETKAAGERTDAIAAAVRAIRERR